MTSALDNLRNYIAIQQTDILVASLVALGDPPAGSAERVAVMHTCDQLEKRHDLTDTIMNLCEADFTGTYSELILMALAAKGVLDQPPSQIRVV